MVYFTQFLIHRDLRFTLLGAWIILAILSLGGSIFDMAEELGLGIILVIISFPLLVKSYSHYRNRPKEEGKRIFLSSLGYVALGVSLGLLIISIILNLSYDESGWFDFRDFGFAIFSYPLITFTHFQPDPDIFSKRIVLYLICFINLIAITYILDVFGLICEKIYKKVRGHSGTYLKT